MRTCARCGRENADDKASHCSFCGAEMAGEGEVKKTLFGYAAPAVPAEPTPDAPDAEPAPDAGDLGADVPGPGYDMSKTVLDASPPVFDLPPRDPAPEPAAPPPEPKPAAAEEPGKSGPTASYSPTLAAPASLPASARGGSAPAVRIGSGEVIAPAAEQSAADTVEAGDGGLDPVPTDPSLPPSGLDPVSPKPPAASVITSERETILAPDPGPAPEPEPAAEPDSAAEPEPDSDPGLAPTSLPGRTLMRVIMALGGLILIGLFFAPWGGAPGNLVHSWDLLRGLGGVAFVSHIYLVAGGLVMLAAALIPLPYLLRALVAVLLGAVPLVLTRFEQVYWSGWVTLGLLALLVGALLHRRRFTGSILSRVLVLLALVGLLAVNLIPRGGEVPLLGVFRSLGAASGMGLASALLPVYLLAVALLAGILCLRGRNSRGLAGFWALLALLYLPLEPWLGVVAGISRDAALIGQLAGIYNGLYSFISLLVCGYGFSLMLARTASHQTS